MTENSSVNLSVGSVVQMDEVQRGVSIAHALQLEDIYLTESEDFWQEQQLNFDKQLFEFIVSDESDGFSLQQSPSTSKQKSTAPFEEFLIDETPTAPMNEIDMTDMSSEMIGAPSSLTGMSLEHTTTSAISDERPMHEVDMAGQASLTDMSSEMTKSMFFEMADKSPSSYVKDTSIEKPVGSVFQEKNEASSASEIGSMQRSGVRNGSQDTPIFQAKQVFQRTIVEQSIKANPKRSCDNTKMFVRNSADKITKQLCCPFCLEPFSKLARHMALKHKKEPDVKRFVDLPKRSAERRFIQDSLRKAGTYLWNSNPKLNKNELIPSRRPNGNSVEEAVRWTTCPYCLGSFTKNNLRHHVATCPVKIQLNPVNYQRVLTKLATIVEGRIHDNASTRLVSVMGFMREDEVVRLVRFDWLLIVFGNKMCCKYTPHYQENMIRARLRLAGRVLTEIKLIDPSVTDFASIYHVERYTPLVSAIRNIGRFDPLTTEFGAPAMASFAVTFVKVIGKYLSAEYIRLRDRENKIETEDFLAYMDTDIDISVNKLVAETQAKMRRRKLQNIPTMEDVKKLIRHINVERNLCFEKLSETYSDVDWLKLAELSMAWIIVFNRRRIGEVQNILVEDFLGRESIDNDSNKQMLATLSADAKSVANKFKRMKIRGKKGRTVPVLLKPAIDKGIQLLLDNRETAGVSADSQYLFQLPSSSSTRIRVVDACRVLRDLSVSCGAINPSSLRGTNLRKHMATTCVSLELNDALISELAAFMGHDEKIHRDVYRQNPIDREVVQMAQLLELAAGKCDTDSDNEDDDIGNGGLSNGGLSATTVRAEPADDEMIFQCIGDESQLRVFNEIGGGNVHVGEEKKKCARVRWTEEEISCVQKSFAGHFKKRTLPGQTEIENQQQENPILQTRTWEQIKAHINNQHKKGTRK